MIYKVLFVIYLKRTKKKRQEAQRLSHAPRKLAVSHSWLLEGKAVHCSIPIITGQPYASSPPCQEGGGLYLYSLFMHTLSTVIAKLFSPGSVTYQYLYRASN